MPTATDLNIEHVARLARIDLTPEEKTTFAAQLGDVLKHIDKLKQIDVTHVEPTAHGFPIYNVWQADEPGPTLPPPKPSATPPPNATT
ncbi:Asp-tRNA(Asn)/Glu-tRNA(Gln) amidotransferase subunit GatC [Geminisphaera colitermitum]|uniref:Asp-tRNA(Asn)/Glu-tRNA(Gln) amidotransferase subunit GatC n=1 Tax=Geminisphaera colitermitum TaxID=1148786 RepID=UPI001E298D2E|nr:Asp-tRNA(Asn)/Glu-tRNA(Gln) amidotransferase subunit GatC [Geminisphaera colitermitum]